MNIKWAMSAGLAWVSGLTMPSRAVEFLSTGDPEHNVTTPGDNSGWQYEGVFNTAADDRSLGVPIAPLYFISAKHVNGAVNDVLVFHGDSYVVTEIHDLAGVDLRIFKVDESKPFKAWAPLVSNPVANGSMVTSIGRGTDRGADVFLGPDLKGWKNGLAYNRQRWGRNLVTNSYTDPTFGLLFYCDFNNPGITDECQLTTGDSGGGTFVMEDGLWKLAGINLGVDGPFKEAPASSYYSAALFDAGGLYYYDGGSGTLIPDGVPDVPSSYYCSDIYSALSDINTTTGGTAILGQEDYPAWQTLYFTPGEIAAPATTGPLADFDSDGVANLLEFALHLDPTFNEQAIMEPATGIRGLPLVHVENVGGSDKVTVEFVRRTVASGSGLTCVARFSSDLETWDAGDTETVTPINPRWERVKAADVLTTGDSLFRFGRVEVVMAP